MRKISILFSETALELVPLEIAGNPIIREEARKRHLLPGGILLDSNKHFLPMRPLLDGERRGRPDILHFSLLACLESLANKKGLVDSVMVHTNSGILLDFSPAVRLPRVYNRFCGIMEQLLAGGKNEFISKRDGVSFKEALSDAARMKGGKIPPSIFFFNEEGKDLRLKQFSSLLAKEISKKGDEPILFVFGCFPHGTFSPEVRKRLQDEGAYEVKFGDVMLPVWSLVSMATNLYEREAGL